MLLSPGAAISSWIRGMVAFAIIMLGALLIIVAGVGVREISDWFNGSTEKPSIQGEPSTKEAKSNHSSVGHEPESKHRFPWKTLIFIIGSLVIGWGFTGHYLHPARLFSKSPRPIPAHQAGRIRRLIVSDGSEIYMETRGPDDAVTVILTHGWSLNHRQWVWLQNDWGDKFRVVVWDLPGFGQSKSHANSDHSLEGMAKQLHAVVEESGPGPVVLMGHSIGGMIILTFCRLYPELIGTRISKLILVHTTYMNPVYTMARSHILTRLQKPLIEPLLHLQIWLWPIVWTMHWLSLWNGSLHRAVTKTCFSKNASRSEIDFIASFFPLGSPAIIARGALSMLAFDETPTLPQVRIPVLVVGGSEDPITDVQASQFMEATLPNATLSTYQLGKHFGFVEFHEDFARQTAEFCSSPD